MILNKNIQDAVDKIAHQLGLPKHVATRVYRSYWEFLKDSIENLPDLGTLSEEELNKLKVNFNVPEIGKFTTSYSKVKKAVNFKEIIRNNLNGKVQKTNS